MWLTFLNHWNGVSLFLGGDVLSSPDLQLFTDASGSHGYGGYLNGEWFQAPWLPQHFLNPTMGISVDWQELFAIYIACYLWGPWWSDKHICMWCDNLPVVSIINSKRSKPWLFAIQDLQYGWNPYAIWASIDQNPWIQWQQNRSSEVLWCREEELYGDTRSRRRWQQITACSDLQRCTHSARPHCSRLCLCIVPQEGLDGWER